MNVVTDPVTKEMLIEALQKLGVSSNQILEVHASLSSFHNVIGGARTVVDALMDLNQVIGKILQLHLSYTEQFVRQYRHLMPVSQISCIWAQLQKISDIEME